MAHSPNLFQRALACSRGLLLLADAGLVVVLTSSQLSEDASLLAGLLEPLHGLLERFVVLDFDHGHTCFLLLTFKRCGGILLPEGL
jgi:hypothetical protein